MKNKIKPRERARDYVLAFSLTAVTLWGEISSQNRGTPSLVLWLHSHIIAVLSIELRGTQCADWTEK